MSLVSIQYKYFTFIKCRLHILLVYNNFIQLHGTGGICYKKYEIE